MHDSKWYCYDETGRKLLSDIIKEWTKINKHNIKERSKSLNEYIKSKKKATERLDPYLIRPSGDEFWSYPENVQKLNEAIKEAHSPNRKVAAVLNSEEEIHKFFAEL